MTVTHIHTHCDEVDFLLGGGFEIGKVTEICAESGMGKTQFCLQSLVTTLLPTELGGLNGSGIYISFMLPFPSRRFESLWNVRAPNRARAAQNLVTQYVGGTPRELLDIVDAVDKVLGDPNSELLNYKAIVLDGLYGFFTHQFPTNSEGFYERAQMIKSLGFALDLIATKYKLAVLVTNMVVDNYGPPSSLSFPTNGRIVKPGVGHHWERRLSLRCLLTKDYDKDTGQWRKMFHITDVKRCSIGSTQYHITSGGIIGGSQAQQNSDV